MQDDQIRIFDTTLRDGAQTNGVDFTLADKLAIAGMLDEHPAIRYATASSQPVRLGRPVVVPNSPAIWRITLPRE